MERGHAIAGSGDAATYVEWFIPPSGGVPKTPIVFVHGGSHDGRCFTQTPDGREGWAQYVAARGYPAYVVDWAGHGRSPASDDLAHLSLATVARGVIAAIEEFPGRAILVVHSMGGVVGWRVAATIPDRIAAIVGIAPGPPAELQPAIAAADIPALQRDETRYAELGRPRYTPEDRPTLVSLDLAREVWTNGPHFPNDAFDAYAATLVPCSARAVNERNNIDGIGLTAGDPAVLRAIPSVVITGDSDPRHPRAADERIARYLGADVVWLADEGLPGHGHMQMIERGSDAIADRFLAWIAGRDIA